MGGETFALGEGGIGRTFVCLFVRLFVTNSVLIKTSVGHILSVRISKTRWRWLSLTPGPAVNVEDCALAVALAPLAPAFIFSFQIQTFMVRGSCSKENGKIEKCKRFFYSIFFLIYQHFFSHAKHHVTVGNGFSREKELLFNSIGYW